MNQKTLTLAVLALALAACGTKDAPASSGPVQDAQGAQPLATAGWRERTLPSDPVQQLLARYDENRNGRLDTAEVENVRKEVAERRALRARTLLDRYDRDGDGRIAGDEREALRADRAARKAKRDAVLLRKYDADGDGVLAPAEREAAKEAGRATLAKANALVLEKYDANRNGRIDLEEEQVLRADVAKRQAEPTP